MDDIPPEVWAAAHMLLARAEANSTDSSSSSSDAASRPPVFKAVGITLAIASGVFIGTSFVLKKIGLLKANAKYNEEAGEGYGYLKNAFWWTGMTLMILGEVCNFVAYAFVDAILVTPLGALSVVITTILSAIFLKERLSFVGKVGCFNCIIGSVVIVMNAPEQSSVADIQEMKHFVIAPGFLSYAGVIIVGCAIIAFFVAPKYGKKSMLVYLSICSLVGGLSVVATQGLGSAVVAQAGGKPQFNQWFLYVLLVFVVATLVVEIVYLNKALNLFNAALVTPTYYVFFTSATIITSAILFQGFKGTATSIATVIMGFLVICSGVVLLQMSKSAKDVPDAAVFKGDLDQVREIAEVEEPETEPKADAIRGTAVLIRRISLSRQKMEQEEARRLREEKMKDLLEPLGENEIVEWDGLRRRKTIIGGERGSTPVRRKTVHPPLGMSHFPEPEEEQQTQQHDSGMGFFGSLRSRATSVLSRHGSSQNQGRTRHAKTDPTSETTTSPVLPISLSDIRLHPSKADSPILPYGPGSFEEAQEHIYGLPAGLRKEPDARAGEVATQPSPRSKPLPAKPPPSPLGPGKPVQEARRQFSFNFLHRQPRTPVEGDDRPTSRRVTSSSGAQQRAMRKMATEEERLGLVKGDSHSHLLSSTTLHLDRDPTREPVEPSGRRPRPPSQTSSSDEYDEKLDGYQYLARPASFSDPDEDDDRQTPDPGSKWRTNNKSTPPTLATGRFADDDEVSAEASDAPTPLLSADATGIHAEPERTFAASSPMTKQTTTDGRQRVVILGSGWAGYVLSQQLDTSKYSVLVVSPRPYFVFTPLLNDSAVGTLEFRNVLESLRKRDGRVAYLQGWADDVNLVDQTITVEPSVLQENVGTALVGQKTTPPPSFKLGGQGQAGGTGARTVPTFPIHYDKLIIAVGCYSQTFDTKGVKENAMFMKDVNDARRVRRRILDLFELARLPFISDTTKGYLLHFAIVGGGPTGIEFAACLSDLITDDLSKMYPDLVKHVRITLYDVAPKVLPMFDKSLSDYAVKLYSRKNIKIKTSHRVVELRRGLPNDAAAKKNQKDEPRHRVYTIETKEDGEVGIGMCVWSTGNMANPFVAKALNHVRRYPAQKAELVEGEVVGDPNESKWIIQRDPRSGLILVDDHFRVHLETDLSSSAISSSSSSSPAIARMTNVFAIGDTTSLKSGHLPGTAQVANQQALWLAKNLNKHSSTESYSANPGFGFKNLGVMTYLGGAKADGNATKAAGENGGNGNVNVKGWVAFLIWRGAYLTMTLSWRNKFLIPIHWLAVRFFGRDVSRF
ncbi:hypothetical protein DV735_g2183, partial [Chaetothyriales sp. CBS 134920]